MKKSNASIQPVGLIGLGLMGRGIATCLLSHGLEVIAYNRTAARARASIGHIQTALDELIRPPNGPTLRREELARPVPPGALARRVGPVALRHRIRQGRPRAQTPDLPHAGERDCAGRGDCVQHVEPADFHSAGRPRASGSLHRHALGRAGADHALPRGYSRKSNLAPGNRSDHAIGRSSAARSRLS